MSKHAIKFDHSKAMTKQIFKNECNINSIMAKFQKTGMIEHYAKHGASYGEVPSCSLHEAMNLVADSENTFNELPSSIRKRFNNNPEEFLQFFEDPKNQEEAIQLGLAERSNWRNDELNDDKPAKSTPKTPKKDASDDDQDPTNT